MTKIFPDQIFPQFIFTRLVLFPDFFNFFTRLVFLPDFFTIFTLYFYPTGLVDDKEDEDNENGTDEFVCVNDDILEFSVIVFENITWI